MFLGFAVQESLELAQPLVMDTRRCLRFDSSMLLGSYLRGGGSDSGAAGDDRDVMRASADEGIFVLASASIHHGGV